MAPEKQPDDAVQPDVKQDAGQNDNEDSSVPFGPDPWEVDVVGEFGEVAAEEDGVDDGGEEGGEGLPVRQSL